MATYDLTSSIPSATSLKAGDILNCPYSGTYKSIILPAGTYKLECWGSRGGGQQDGNSNAGLGGMGGYSYGILTLQATTTLYCYSGGIGAVGYSALSAGGFNGGGSAWGAGSTEPGCGGGGASDIRVGSTSLYARVIVAGGGGGGGEDSSDSVGYGGGTSGGTGGAAGGSQTSGGDFGQGRHAYDGGGGGGGWYGGLTVSNLTSPPTSGPGTDNNGGGGGSGYVYTSSTVSNYPSGCLLNSNYYLTSASTVAGNTSFTSPTGSSETGHGDSGYVRITINGISAIMNGNWIYSLDSTILYPTTTLATTSVWDLTSSTCKKFKVIPSSSGFLQVYSSSNTTNGNTYGFIATSDVTSISSNGNPTSYQYYDNDSGGSRNFKMVIPVTANTTYYLWVRPYNSSSTISSTKISYQIINPKIMGIYVKTATSTWIQMK